MYPSEYGDGGERSVEKRSRSQRVGVAVNLLLPVICILLREDLAERHLRGAELQEIAI